MKNEICIKFKVHRNKVSVIPHGIMDAVPITEMNRFQARSKLGYGEKNKILLFFGYIAPYKGLDILINAFERISRQDENARLLIVGSVKDCPEYWEKIEKQAKNAQISKHIRIVNHYVKDVDVEIYFKTADVLVMPYRSIFQSGLPFLSFHFGLPVIASDVGSLKEIIEDGENGYICEPGNVDDLAEKINCFFQSELFNRQDEYKLAINVKAKDKFSWKPIGEQTGEIYKLVCNQ